MGIVLVALNDVISIFCFSHEKLSSQMPVVPAAHVQHDDAAIKSFLGGLDLVLFGDYEMDVAACRGVSLDSSPRR